jgi:hypothetical protein
MTNTLFENVGKLKQPYLELKASDNRIYEVTRKLNSGNCHYHFVQNNCLQVSYVKIYTLKYAKVQC